MIMTPRVHVASAQHIDIEVHAQGTRHWTTAFTGRLDDDTKLVGR